MALKVQITLGGASGATTSDFTSIVQPWEVSESGNTSILDTGMRFDGSGGACQWQLLMRDDAGDYGEGTPNWRAHHVVTVSEDGPGYFAWLGRGRISTQEISRGDHPWGSHRTHELTIDDANMDLRGLALTEPWSRGSESGRARVLAVVTAFLSGSPRVTTNISSHLVASGGEVTMPAKEYAAGTDVIDILQDCAETEGKVVGVVIHHQSSASHLCLLYIDEADHTTYASTLSITDTNPDLSTEFPPIWDQGPAVVSDGQELATTLVSTYGAGTASYVTVEDSADADFYDYWAVPYNDSVSVTPTQATQRATAILNARSVGVPTYQVSLQLTADKVDLIAAGMSIDITAAVISDTTQTRRIAQVKWEPIAPEVGAVEGVYLAHLQLDRPLRVLAAGKGTPPIFDPPASPFADDGLIGAACSASGSNAASDHPAWSGDNEELVQITASQSVAVGDSMIAQVAFNKTGGAETSANTVYDERGNTWTKDAEYENTSSSGDNTIQTWRCNVTTAIQAGDYIRFAFNLGPSILTTLETSARCIGVRAYSGTLSSPSVGTGAGGFSSSPALTMPSGGLQVVGIAWWGTSPTTITGDGDFSDMVPRTTVAGSSIGGDAVYGQQVPGGGQATWNATFGAVTDWAAIGVAYTTSGVSGGTTEPIGADGEADPGDSTAAAREDHVHEHSHITTGGPYHNADQITIADAGGYFTGTDVEAALQELGVASDTYVEKANGGKETLNTVASSGSTETLDLADGNWHDVTLTADCTLTLTGATNGTGCSMLVILRQDGTGGRTVTWPGSVVWPGDVAPTLASGAGDVTLVSLLTNDGGTTWFGAYPGSGGSGGSDTQWVVDPGSPSYSGSGPVTVTLTSVFGIDSSGNPYYNSANVTDGEEAALWWDSDTESYFLRPYYP